MGRGVYGSRTPFEGFTGCSFGESVARFDRLLSCGSPRLRRPRLIVGPYKLSPPSTPLVPVINRGSATRCFDQLRRAGCKHPNASPSMPFGATAEYGRSGQSHRLPAGPVVTPSGVVGMAAHHRPPAEAGGTTGPRARRHRWAWGFLRVLLSQRSRVAHHVSQTIGTPAAQRAEARSH